MIDIYFRVVVWIWICIFYFLWALLPKSPIHCLRFPVIKRKARTEHRNSAGRNEWCLFLVHLCRHFRNSQVIKEYFILSSLTLSLNPALSDIHTPPSTWMGLSWQLTPQSDCFFVLFFFLIKKQTNSVDVILRRSSTQSLSDGDHFIRGGEAAAF